MSQEDMETLRRGYEAFNRRDIDAALEGMHREVEWPNMLEGTTIRGHEAIREYWTKQFQMSDPTVEPEEFIHAGERLVVVVHQVVRDHNGDPLVDQRVAHVYAFRNSKIARMDVYESETTLIYADYAPSAHEGAMVERAFSRGPIRGPKLRETQVNSGEPVGA